MTPRIKNDGSRRGGSVDPGTVSYRVPGYAMASGTDRMRMASGGRYAASARPGAARITIIPAGGRPAFSRAAAGCRGPCNIGMCFRYGWRWVKPAGMAMVSWARFAGAGGR